MTQIQGHRSLVLSTLSTFLVSLSFLVSQTKSTQDIIQVDLQMVDFVSDHSYNTTDEDNQTVTVNYTRKTVFEKVAYYFNSDSTVQKEMRPDLSFSEVLLGVLHLDANDWGVNCQDNDFASTHCSYKKSKAYFERISYSNLTYGSYWMNVPNPLKDDGGYNLNDDYLKARALFNQTESGKKVFLTGDVGIMGMAPNSPYFKNIFNHYAFEDDKFVFTFEYNINPNRDWWNGSDSSGYESNCRLSLNGFVDQDLEQKKLKTVELKKDAKFWEIPQVNLTFNNSRYASGPLCITNSENSILALLNPDKLTKAISQSLCKKDENCTSIANNSAPLTLQFKDFNLSLDFDDYIYQHEVDIPAKNDHKKETPPSPTQRASIYSASIEDLQHWKKVNKCSKESVLAVGRLFLAKYAVIFTYSNNPKKPHTVSFGVKKTAKTLSSAQMMLYLSISSGMIALTLVLLVIKMVVQCRIDKNQKSKLVKDSEPTNPDSGENRKVDQFEGEAFDNDQNEKLLSEEA